MRLQMGGWIARGRDLEICDSSEDSEGRVLLDQNKSPPWRRVLRSALVWQCEQKSVGEELVCFGLCR
jgi:hypothetical protein